MTRRETAAPGDGHAGATGGYYVKSQQREPSPGARDAAAALRLWQLSEELTGLTPARPTGP